MPKFRIGAENFVRRKKLCAKKFVTAEIMSDKVYFLDTIILWDVFQLYPMG